MDRIAVIGCGGAGKTHLAARLAAILRLPLTHLDAVYYDAEWNTLPANEFAARQEELTAEPRWLIEGNYASTLAVRLARANTVIFLDLPARVCLAGVLRRRWRYRGGQHPEDGVYDRIDRGFLRYICRYRKTMRPKVSGLIAEHGGNARVLTFTSRRQVAKFLARVRADAAADPPFILLAQ